MAKGKYEDLTGRRYGRLVVIGRSKERGNCNQVRWDCICDCGNTHSASTQSLSGGHTKSCGCFNRERHTKHGESRSDNKLYRAWSRIRERCNSPSYYHFKDYGGRGIKVCDEWEESYQAFRDWAVANGYKEGLSIDRIDVNGNYEPSNCRWVTLAEQQRNKRTTKYITYMGETKSVPEWCDIYNLDQGNVRRRLLNGWNPEECLFGRKGNEHGKQQQFVL